ncbi:hypothetical protein ACC763_40055, partial [Rhizobium ruizarguesonis]
MNDYAGEKQEATLLLFLPPILTSTWMSLRILAFLEDNPHIRLKMEFGIVLEAIDWRHTDAAI